MELLLPVVAAGQRGLRRDFYSTAVSDWIGRDSREGKEDRSDDRGHRRSQLV